MFILVAAVVAAAIAPVGIDVVTADGHRRLVPVADADAIADRYLEATGQYLALYNELIGAFPYREFVLVENFWETGYGMPSFTLLGPQVLRFPFILHTSWPHELLHNWWGNGVRPDWRSGNWSEGLTTLMADHALRAAQSPDAARLMRWSWLRDFAAIAPGSDTPLDRFTARTHGAASAVGYGKSAMLFHMVRAEIGEATFDEALRAESGSFHDVGLTEDLAEGTTAFRERRDAVFKGR